MVNFVTQPSRHSFQQAALNLTESVPSMISICTSYVLYRACGFDLPMAGFRKLLNKEYVLTWLRQSVGNFSTTERFATKYGGTDIMYIISKKPKKYNITDERAALYEAAETWTRFLNGKGFLGGSKPNLADLSVFGVLRPIWYPKAGRYMVENAQIGEWYQRMETAVGRPSGVHSWCAYYLKISSLCLYHHFAIEESDQDFVMLWLL